MGTGPGDQRTRRKRTRGLLRPRRPEDWMNRGLEEERSRGLEDQRTLEQNIRGPEDQKTRVPKDQYQKTRGP
jgi:hypothetical protein